MLSQTAIARTWGPGCYRGPKLRITLNGGGVVTVRAAIGDAVLALDAVLRAYGYRTRPRDTGALVCRDKVGHPGEKSNHSYGTALDLNWQSNPYGTRRTDMGPHMVAAVCAIRTNSGAQVWNWGGYWKSSPDPMHFEIVCTPADIASGIRRGSVPSMPAPLAKPVATTATQVPVIPHLDEGDDEMVRIVRDERDGKIYKVMGKPAVIGVHIETQEQLAHALAELEVDATGKPLGRRATSADVPTWAGADIAAIRML
jgi:hypothetical protein